MANPMGRIAVVTGAAGTLGLGIVAKLVEQDLRVAMVDNNGPLLDEVIGQFPPDRVMGIVMDICDDGAPAAIDAAVCARWQAATILVNNAGISPKHQGLSTPVTRMTKQEWQRTMDVNVTSQMFLAAQFIPHMQAKRWGRIVNISTRAARSNVNNSGPGYVTSKAAVLGLTRSLACDHAAFGITCNAIAPGLVESALTRQLPPERLKLLLDRTPVGRAGKATEVGAAVAFLVSDDAGFITGACLDINGGATMV